MALLPGYRPCFTNWCPAARVVPIKARRSKLSVVASAADLDTSRLFVFGLGYTGLGLVRHLQRQGGWHCFGTCRTLEKAAALAQSGVGAHVYDPDNLHFLGSDALQDLSASTHILSTIAPNADFDRDPVRSKELTCRSVLAMLGCLASAAPPAALGSSSHSCVRGASRLGQEAHCEPMLQLSGAAGAAGPRKRAGGPGGGWARALGGLCEQHQRVRRLGRRLGRRAVRAACQNQALKYFCHREPLGPVTCARLHASFL